MLYSNINTSRGISKNVAPQQIDHKLILQEKTMENFDKIYAEARAQRAAVIGELIGKGIFQLAMWSNPQVIIAAFTKTAYWLGAKVLNSWDTLGKFSDRVMTGADNQMRDSYFAGSANLADLEHRQRDWEQNRQYRY
jgi:hypothetical protein